MPSLHSYFLSSLLSTRLVSKTDALLSPPPSLSDIHDADFYNSTSLDTMQQARDLANYHEHAVFTDPELDGIGNIAFQTLLGPILDGFERIENTTVGLKMMYLGCAYKPFLSLFNMTEVSNPNIVDCSSLFLAFPSLFRQSPSLNFPLIFLLFSHRCFRCRSRGSQLHRWGLDVEAGFVSTSLPSLRRVL